MPKIMPIQNSKHLTCASCNIPIRWQPTVVDGKAYCCLGCAAGGPCECDYDHLPMPSDRVSIVVRREQVARLTTHSGWIYESASIKVERRSNENE